MLDTAIRFCGAGYCPRFTPQEPDLIYIFHTPAWSRYMPGVPCACSTQAQPKISFTRR